jgi:hypothetical protein
MPAYTPRVIVTVNGVRRQTLGGTTVCGFLTSFSTATVRFVYDTPKPDPGDLLTVLLGYDETGQQVAFVGEIDDTVRDYWPRTRTVTASGTLARMQRGINVEDESLPVDPTLLERPAYQAEGQTDAAIVQALCDLYAITTSDIQADVGNGGPRTFGNIEPVRLAKNQPAWSIVQDLDRLTFMVTFNAPDGTVRRLSVNGIPSLPAITLVEAQTILRGTATETRKGIVNAVTMRGLPDAGGAGVTPSAERRASSRYIPAPPTYVPEEWQSPLAETEFVCDLYASRRVGQLNRLQGQTIVRPSRGRPDIYPAMSLALNAPDFEYGPAAIFWVAQVQHSWDAKGISTDLTLNVASLAGGINPNQPPVPLITITMHKEVLDSGATIWVVAADGRASYDPDGVAIDLDPQHGITTYLWSGSPVGPATPAGLPIATYVYTSDPTGAQICLTVTDTSLKLATACVTITATDVARAMTRDLWAAVTTDLLFFAGAIGTWQSTLIPAVGCCEIAHPVYQLAWRALPGGTLDKIVVGGDGTLAAQLDVGPAQVTAASINLGVNGTGTRRAWAGSADGKVWLSLADGDAGSWVNVGTIVAPTGSADNVIRAIEESPFQSGALLAICGPALFRSFDRGVTWVQGKTYPDLALVATRLATGRFADLTVDKSYQWLCWAGTSANVAARLDEASDQEDVDWPNAAKPAQPTGLTIGATRPGLYLTDVGGGGNGRTWAIDDFTGGGELVQRLYDVMLGAPRHIIRDSTFDGTIYGAAEFAIFKTDDYFLSTPLKLLDLSTTPIGAASKDGKMVGFGALHATVVPPGEVILSLYGAAGGHIIARRLPTGSWAKLSDHPVSDAAAAPMISSTSGIVHRPLLRCQNRLFTWLSAWGLTSGIAFGAQNGYYSDDWGVTWLPLSLKAVQWLAVDANGTTLYALNNNVADPPEGGGSVQDRVDAIHRSTDNGATWTKMSDLPPGFLNSSGGCTIMCSQDTSGTVVLLHGDGFRISGNGGATFGATFGPSSHVHFPYSGSFARSPADNAQLVSIFNSGNHLIFYVPDNATPGTLLFTNPDTLHESYFADIQTIGGIVWLADGRLRYSTNGGATLSAATTPPDTVHDAPHYGPAVHALAGDTNDPTRIFFGGQPDGSPVAGVAYPAYWTYNIDNGDWTDITTTHFADLGGMYYPLPYSMIVRPAGT